MSDLDKTIAALGENINEIITKALTVEDIRMQRTASVDFMADPEKGVYGKGLNWRAEDKTKKLTYRANPDRIWISENIDLEAGRGYSIGNATVLTEDTLGSSVRNSDLTKVGTLKNLRTQGNLTINDFIFYDGDTDRLGFGTETPNAMVSIASLDSEFVIDLESANTRIGNWTTDTLEILTDNTARITIGATGNIKIGSDVESKVSVSGKLGVGVTNPPNDASITAAGAIRFDSTKFETGESMPTQGNYTIGDIVWNLNPQPTGYVGWICVRTGTPGEWKPFGKIAD